MTQPVTAVIIGAGNRGSAYATYGIDHPDKFKVVGVAEPRSFYRQRMQKAQNISDDKVFASWTEAAELTKFADCAVITTQDQMHAAPAIAFAKKGYHILLEKPMAVSYADCCEIVSTCKSAGVMLAVCHVLRYTPQARKISQLIDAGVIGEVVNIQHLEPVGYWHFAHSFVRGNWRNTKTSTFSLLAKSCHDLDLIHMWMGNKRCTSISSFGSLKHFTKDNKPASAASRCVDCRVESSCPYSANVIYLERVKSGQKGWPVSVITEVPDVESVTEAIRSGPYGRCVYDCDNDVVDNQVVTMQFEGGATASFSMIAFTDRICERNVKIFGTKGELSCDFGTLEVVHFDFVTRKRVVHSVNEECSTLAGSQMSGHGGADFFAMHSFVNAVATGDKSHIMTGPDASLYSHYLCFMTEKARLEGRVINLVAEQVHG